MDWLWVTSRLLQDAFDLGNHHVSIKAIGMPNSNRRKHGQLASNHATIAVRIPESEISAWAGPCWFLTMCRFGALLVASQKGQ